ncbi:hypothetical protein [uncultured Sphingomonas sp.]|uniref:hypothetical protein n=1 Tax=uncultured Sphingomonas sp. TaxID=158754 RepID=UPI0025DE706E|nr:hypothetical protein [uncultured Sphingomonas sp.]
MIRLKRAERPAVLDQKTVNFLTEKFKKDGSSVWRIDEIRQILLESSFGKCAFCEARLDEESKYVEVEHFRNKNDFPDEVVSWNNLLPACKRCNVRKSIHNVDVDGMIVNPYDDEPRDHIYISHSRMKSKTPVGRETIEALYLNQSDRLVSVRAEIANRMEDALEKIRENMDVYLQDKATKRQLRKVTQGLEALFAEACPKSQFSATAATAILSNDDYLYIKDKLISINGWQCLEEAEGEAAKCRLNF